MILTLEPTEQFFLQDDVMVRLWQGHTDSNEPVVALISAVIFSGQAEAAAEGLVSIPAPTPEDAARWARKVLGDNDS